MRNLLTVLFMSLVAGVLLPGAAARPAPPLELAEWIKGGPINLADGRGETVYVIEFWATWCAPCRKSIPNMTAFQQHFAQHNVRVIGIAAEPIAKVRAFVEKMGNQMGYAVAVDKNGQTSRRYNQPAQVKTIPHAYVVDQEGNIAWHGFPDQKMVDAVVKLLPAPQQQPAEPQSQEAEQTNNDINSLRSSGGIQLGGATQLKQLYFDLAKKGGTAAERRAEGVCRQFLQGAGNDAAMLQAFARRILDDETLAYRSLRHARLAAEAADKAARHSNAAIAETLGDVYLRLQQPTMACRHLERAHKLFASPTDKQRLQQKMQACR